MAEFGTPTPRVSALPWGLYQSENLAPLLAARERDGFYAGMLKDDLQKQRYAYEVSFVPQGVDFSRASAVLLALLNDFNRRGYDRDPAALVCDFAGSLLEECVEGAQMLLELHALPDECNRATPRHALANGSEQQVGALPSLGFVPRWSVKEHRSGVSQVAADVGQPAVVIPRSRIQRIGLREENANRWKKTITDLGQVDAVKMIGGDLDRLSWTGYVFSDHVATQNLAVAATTAPIGWDARGTFSDSVTSPYLAFRRLRFVRFWVEAIEDSVAFLNQFTNSESLYGDDAFTFSLSGPPPPHDLTEAMGAIRSGSLTVEKAHSTYFFPKYAKHRPETPDGA